MVLKLASIFYLLLSNRGWGNYIYLCLIISRKHKFCIDPWSQTVRSGDSPHMNSQSSHIQKTLEKLGYSIARPNAPLASYVPAKSWQDLVFVSGQLPFKAGSLLMTGAMQAGQNLSQAQEAMLYCFLNGLAAAAQEVTLDKLKGVLRLGAYVASAPDFTEQHLVANGASELAQSLFGAAGMHTRFAVGVSSLPMNATVELEMLFHT